MAEGTFSATVIATDRTKMSEIVYGELTLSSATDTYATNGLILDLTGYDEIKSSYPPIVMVILPDASAGSSPSGWQYYYCPGTTLANGRVAIFNGTTQFTGSAALTAPAADSLIFFAVFAWGL